MDEKRNISDNYNDIKGDNYIDNDYIRKDNYIDNDYIKRDNYIDNNKYKKIGNKYDLNKLGDYGLSDNMEYALYLYILYCNKFGYDPSKVVDYIIDNSISNSNVLFSADKDFKKWVLINYDLKNIYVNHLRKMGIDLLDENVIELYKGKLDSIMDSENVISPYSTTMNKYNSIIYKRNENLYKISYNNIDKIQDGKTFLIQNPYSIASLLYLLETLGNTDNKVIISFWGSVKDCNKNNLLSMISDIMEFLSLNGNDSIKTKFDEENGFYIYSFIINTKMIKKENDISELVTKKDMELIDSFYLESNVKGR